MSYIYVNNRSIVCIRNITVTSSNSLESRQFFTNSLRTQPNWSIFFPKMSFTEWPFKLHSGKSWETRWAKPKLPKTAFIGGTWYKVRRYKDINIFFYYLSISWTLGTFRHVTWLCHSLRMSFCYNLLSVISLVPWRSLAPLSAQSLGKSGQKTLSQRVSLGDITAHGRVQDW